ncbi:carbohydrate ABC transporter permease [Aureibacillus halotolerans]|uniref:Carbohydrate ABC transporter membrane protein 2 (CUT1 family) n=1 Tax=Aureibacillus halotolerans TaxID=1508390 RepID=A0A4R6U8L1_9BACI|nr:carbohydrate ABC transporter permease [Aureibacillus halotolerans]TDQ42920.1 carbohydrate ABC transporter membrane protein 2 (CUT1 family) [Aureibacillus halotolerans]
MKETTQDRAFGIFVGLTLTVITIIVMYPLVYVLSASFSNPAAILRGELWLWPVEPTFEAYQSVMNNSDIWLGYRNTIIYTVLGTLFNLVLSVLVAYPLSRRDFHGRHVLTLFLVITMFFNGGMIPTYLLIRDLDMLNTIWAVIIPGAVSVYNVIVIRTFFQSIPEEMRESAQLDGCNNIQYLTKILLPLSKPVLAVMVLFYGVSQWNAFFDALIYLTDRGLYPLQLFLREMLIQDQMSEMIGISDATLERHMMRVEGIKYAVVIVASLPMLILYPFLQRFFVKGVMIGSIKG